MALARQTASVHVLKPATLLSVGLVLTTIWSVKAKWAILPCKVRAHQTALSVHAKRKMFTHKHAVTFALKVSVVTTAFTPMWHTVTSISPVAVLITPLHEKAVVVASMLKVWNTRKRKTLFSPRRRCMVYRLITATSSMRLPLSNQSESQILICLLSQMVLTPKSTKFVSITIQKRANSNTTLKLGSSAVII